jgi:hypothetical protein
MTDSLADAAAHGPRIKALYCALRRAASGETKRNGAGRVCEEERKGGTIGQGRGQENGSPATEEGDREEGRPKQDCGASGRVENGEAAEGREEASLTSAAITGGRGGKEAPGHGRGNRPGRRGIAAVVV